MIGQTAVAVVVVGVAAVAGMARADVFSMPAGQKSLELVTVGDPGNQPDTRYVSSGIGAVGYAYQLGKFDVTAGQYAKFLNAVAASDPYGLYNPFMAQTSISTFVGCGITRNGQAGSYNYSVIAGRENMPVNWISWGDAARFANWLSNGQPSRAEGPGSTETGSYTLNGAISNAELIAIVRNSAATYVIPTENEWYKAAYYKGGSTNAGYWTYTTRSDGAPNNVLSSTGTNNANFRYWSTSSMRYVYTDPTNYLTEVGAFAGSPGPYGIFDQGGNVSQWMDTISLDPFYTERGGSYSGDSYGLRADCRAGDLPAFENIGLGFRIALVPEPVSALLLIAGIAGSVLTRRSTCRG